MGSNKSAAGADEQGWEIEDTEPPAQECLDRALVLRREPLPWKMQLIASGVRDIRCSRCARIRPIAGAEELDEGWICEDCLLEPMEEWRYEAMR